MARTGSGKTLAYIIPMIQRLASSTRQTPAIRGLILCPNRELAVQILKVGKDIARGMRTTESRPPLRWSVIIGGEAMEKQFELLSRPTDM